MPEKCHGPHDEVPGEQEDQRSPGEHLPVGASRPRQPAPLNVRSTSCHAGGWRKLRFKASVLQARSAIEKRPMRPFPALYTKSVDGLTLRNDRMVRSICCRLYRGRLDMPNPEYCRPVDVAGNRLKGDVPGRDVCIENRKPSEVTVAPGQ